VVSGDDLRRFIAAGGSPVVDIDAGPSPLPPVGLMN
jgi:hypothetical protein